MPNPNLALFALLRRRAPHLCFGLLVSLGSLVSLLANENLCRADEYKTVRDISYASMIADADDYAQERCRLDIYFPTDKKRFATVVWFHGGGLKAGNRKIAHALQQQGIAVVAANYRLHPKVQSPVYIEDAAAAVAWTFRNIAKYGGDPKLIFVSGHSAGGYLTSMVGLDARFLKRHQLDHRELAGLIPFSGHTITHFTVRAERGIDGKQPIVDEFAPLYHVSKDLPPILLITGDRDLELLGRYEENAYFWRMLRVAGHAEVELHELEGFNHGEMVEPAYPLLLKFVSAQTNKLHQAAKP